MMRSSFDGGVLIVEGITDLRLYGKYTDENVKTIVAFSKHNVKETIKKSKDRKESKIVGVIDADLDRLNNKRPSSQIFMTDNRD